MENESIGKRGMGINYKGSQGQTERAVVLKEEYKSSKFHALVALLPSKESLLPTEQEDGLSPELV